MPQLDFGNWLNSTARLLLAFWAITYLFFLVFLAQGAWLLKMRAKLTTLRTLVATTWSRQTRLLRWEVLVAQLMIMVQAAAVNRAVIGAAQAGLAEALVPAQAVSHPAATTGAVANEVAARLELILPELAELEEEAI